MTPTPTPRTDALELENIGLAWGDAQDAVLGLARELERELEQERQDRKQADIDTIRALGERNDARAELAAERALADRLAKACESVRLCINGGALPTPYRASQIIRVALASWKEARRE
jgi:hypothetical protein